MSQATHTAASANRAPARTNRLEAAPLIGVCCGLLLGVIPLFDKVSPLALLLFIGAMTSRILIYTHRLRLPSLPVKVVFLAVGLGAVILNYDTLLGIAPGLSILLVLHSLKLLETNSVRDFQVLTLVGWFIGLCILFFSQAFTTWLYVAGISLILLCSLIRFHRGAGSRSFLKALRLSLTLSLQAAPLILLLFVIFPRNYGGFQFSFSQGLRSSSGMSDHLAPGSVSSMALNSAPAFRVEFPDHNMPPTSQLYWRGGVLWRGEGLNWVAGQMYRVEPPTAPIKATAIRQRIVLEPHNGRWIFALDRPATRPPRMNFEAGSYLQSVRPVVSSVRYEVISQTDSDETALPAEQKRIALKKPERISERVQALVNSWQTGAPTDRELVARATSYFRQQNFAYSLNPGSYQDYDALDEFLFIRRKGFCEHYAAAFASLMRIAGVPARLVMGYHGGEFNALGNYVLVRQSDAHAWCEVWIQDAGWLRVDPVQAIAPERIQSGFGSFLDGQAFNTNNQSGAMGNSDLRAVFRRIRMAWDGANYQWDLRVLNFDEDSQRTLFHVVGLDPHNWVQPLRWAALGLALVLTAVALWLRRSFAPRLDAGNSHYQQFCRILGRAGLPRAPHEGPLDFAQRAARHFSPQAAAIERITELYIEYRYGARPPQTKLLGSEVQALRRSGLTPKPKDAPKSTPSSV